MPCRLLIYCNFVESHAIIYSKFDIIVVIRPRELASFHSVTSFNCHGRHSVGWLLLSQQAIILIMIISIYNPPRATNLTTWYSAKPYLDPVHSPLASVFAAMFAYVRKLRTLSTETWFFDTSKWNWSLRKYSSISTNLFDRSISLFLPSLWLPKKGDLPFQLQAQQKHELLERFPRRRNIYISWIVTAWAKRVWWARDGMWNSPC